MSDMICIISFLKQLNINRELLRYNQLDILFLLQTLQSKYNIITPIRGV